MDFVAVVDQVIALLRQRGRVTYSTLKRQFQLDDAALEDVKNELIEGQRLAVDERGNVLVWTGRPLAPPCSPPPCHPRPCLPRQRRAPQTPSPAPPEAERRQLTVLFCDLVGLDGARRPARPGRPARGGAGLSRDLRQGDRPL